MGNESIIASTTQFQTLLIALVLIVAVIYFFIELRRVDSRISSLETSIKNLINGNHINGKTEANNETKTDFIKQTILNNDIENKDELPTDIDEQYTHVDEQYTHIDEQPTHVDEQPTDIDEHYTDIDEQRPDIEENKYEQYNDIEEVLSNGKKELDSGIEKIAVSGLSILSYMPIMSNQVNDKNIEEIELESSIQVSNIQESNVKEVDVELNIDELEYDVPNIQDSNIEELNIGDLDENNNVEKSNEDNSSEEEHDDIDELDLTEPIEENIESIKDMTIKELKNILNNMDLPTSGNKTKLIQRIVSNQK